MFEDYKNSSRYPYTFAYDNLRQTINKPDLSRAECAQLVEKICNVAGLDKPTICSMLADEFCKEN